MSSYEVPASQLRYIIIRQVYLDTAVVKKPTCFASTSSAVRPLLFTDLLHTLLHSLLLVATYIYILHEIRKVITYSPRFITY
jgi:hypothetical protein